MPWKRGRDGITTGARSQSIDKGGAIQQSFGSLNFNYLNNCYGLFGGYDYGNISLVLNNRVKQNCIYTIGDTGIPFYNIYAVAHALVRCSESKNIIGENNKFFLQVKKSILYGDSGADEQLEVQIFQDVKFGQGGNVEKIVCVGVSDKDYIQLLQMAGANVELEEDGSLIEKEEYKNFVERY